MVTECPTCSDTARFGVVAAARVLGIDRGTFRRYAAKLRLMPSVARTSGRSVYTGRQVKMMWRAAV